MSRTQQWYLDTAQREEKAIKRLQESLAGHIRRADYYQASQKCDELKAALLSLNTCENKLADLEQEEEERADAGN